MAGYRDSSNFDPYGVGTRPVRPFNWVQWVGVALLAVSVGLNLTFLAGQAGWLPRWGATPALSTAPMMFGVILMNSRREPTADPAPELAPARRKWMFRTVTVVALILTVSAIIDIARS